LKIQPAEALAEPGERVPGSAGEGVDGSRSSVFSIIARVLKD